MSTVVFRAGGILFEWDSVKASANVETHGVSFEEALTVFTDALARVYPDPDHSNDEERFLLVGQSSASRTLLVVHATRTENIRLISARRVTRRERRAFEEER